MPSPDRKAAQHSYRMKVVDETGQPIKENGQEVFFEAEQRTNGVMGEKYFCMEKGCINHSNSRGWKRSDQLKQHAKAFHNVAFQDLRGIECKRMKALRCGCGLEYTKPQDARSHWESCQAEGGFRVGVGGSVVSAQGEFMSSKGSTGHFSPEHAAQEAEAATVSTGPNLPSEETSNNTSFNLPGADGALDRADVGPDNRTGSLLRDMDNNAVLGGEQQFQGLESSMQLYSCPVQRSLYEVTIEPGKMAESLSSEILEMELNRRKLAAAAEPRETVLSVLNSGPSAEPMAQTRSSNHHLYDRKRHASSSSLTHSSGGKKRRESVICGPETPFSDHVSEIAWSPCSPNDCPTPGTVSSGYHSMYASPTPSPGGFTSVRGSSVRGSSVRGSSVRSSNFSSRRNQSSVYAPVLSPNPMEMISEDEDDIGTEQPETPEVQSKSTQCSSYQEASSRAVHQSISAQGSSGRLVHEGERIMWKLSTGGPDGEDLWLDGVVKKMAKSVQKQFPNAYNVKTTENELLSIELLPDGAWCVKRGNTWLLGGQYSLGEAPRHFQLLQESTD